MHLAAPNQLSTSPSNEASQVRSSTTCHPCDTCHLATHDNMDAYLPSAATRPPYPFTLSRLKEVSLPRPFLVFSLCCGGSVWHFAQCTLLNHTCVSQPGGGMSLSFTHKSDNTSPIHPTATVGPFTDCITQEIKMQSDNGFDLCDGRCAS